MDGRRSALYTAQEPAVRVWGMLLQLLGIGAVVHELRKTNQHYGRPGFRGSARRAWERRPWARGTASASIQLEGVSATVTGHAVVIRATSSLGVERRLEILEKKFQAATMEMQELSTRLTTEETEREAADRREAATRASDIKDLDRRIEEVVTGAVSVSMLGVWALALGVVLASAAAELVGIRNWLLG